MRRIRLVCGALSFVGCAPRVGGADGTGDTSDGSGGCVVGQVACACTPGGGCDPGLQCIVGVCIPDDLETGTLDTGSLDSGEAASSPMDTSVGELDTGVESGPSESSADASSSGGIPVDCGNGRLDADEACDDGNTVTGDGCNADCQPGGQEIWTVVLDGDSLHRDEPHRVAIDADDDIYFAGNAWKVGLNDSDGLLVKLDDDGQLQWTDRQDSGAIGDSNDGYWGVAVLPDQSVVATGWRYLPSFSREGVVRAYSEDGDELWHHFEPDAGESFAYDVDVDSLGDVVVTGAVHDPMDGTPQTWLAKFSSDGDVLWNYRLDVPSVSGTLALAVDDSDAIVIAAASGYAYVRKLDADAGELWTYSDLLPGAFLGVAATVDDGIFVTGASGGADAYFAHHPSDGIDPDWSDGWPGSFGGAAYANAVAIDGAGRTVWVGTESGGGHTYIFARKLDTDGDAVWTHEVMGADNGNDTAFGVAIDSLDQPVVVARQRNAGSDDDFWIRKLSP